MIRLLFIFCISSLQVAALNGSTDKGAVYEEEASKFITKFSFSQLTGGIVVIRASIDDFADSLNFILDTGSGAISLDSATAAELRIPSAPSGMKLSGIAGVREVNSAINHQLHLPGLTVDSLDFYINDYELLSSVYGVKIDGIIGYSFLSRYIVTIDYDVRLISVYTKGVFAYPKGSYLLKPFFTRLPIQPLTIRDTRKIKGNFYFDIGAGLCFLLSQQFEEDSSVLKRKRRPVEMYVQGAGGKRMLQLTLIKRLRVGPYVFRKVPANIMDDEHNALSYPRIGGLIGNDVLRRFNVVLDYEHETIAIRPNTHFHDVFDYSYTGMNMYVGEDGVIVMDDIVDGSPAAKSGLKNGDVILGVGGRFNGNIAEYREILRYPGERVSILISRNGMPEMIRLKVGKIR